MDDPQRRASTIPDRFSVHATRAAMAVLAAMTVRTVLRHKDEALAASVVTAPVLAARAVGIGLWLAYRGRSVLFASSVGMTSYAWSRRSSAPCPEDPA